MESLGYSDFSQRIVNQVVHQRVPVTGTIEVTRRCPLNCVHCYNNLPMADSKARSSELTYEEHCRILDEISQAGCLWLLYTGGEPFLRTDFLDIYTYAKRKGMLITLFTNGILMTPRIVDHLAESRPFSIEITLYGYSKETYERITRVEGSYERCMRGIRLIRDRQLPLSLKTVVTTLNKHELGDMKRFAEQELSMEFRFDAMINPRIDPSPGPLAFRLSSEEVVALDFEDPKRVAEWEKFCHRFNGPVLPPGQWDNLYHCGGGIDNFGIDPYGMLSLCNFSRRDLYNLRQGSFQEGWTIFMPEVRDRRITRLTRCVSCEIKAMCGMCPANAELENMNPEEPVDFMCQVAHLRAKALGLTPKPHGDCEYCKRMISGPAQGLQVQSVRGGI